MEVPLLGPLPLMAPTADPELLAAQARVSGGQAREAVAQGFESMFAAMLVKELRQSLEPETMFGQDRAEILGGLFDFFLGQQMAQSGQLGIGAMVKKQLTQVMPHGK
jgi:Rod binding domain-containing protein